MSEIKQPGLFCENINDALREAIMALGGTKKIGAALKPEKTADEAARWVSDCLNTDRRERFTPEHVLFLIKESRKVGYHSLVNFICTDGGYTNPMPVEPEDEKAKLMREFIEATKQQTINVQRLERLQMSSGLKAVA